MRADDLEYAIRLKTQVVAKVEQRQEILDKLTELDEFIERNLRELRALGVEIEV